MGHLRAKGRKKIFPIEAADGKDNFQVGVNQIGRYSYGGRQVANPQPFRVYESDGLAPCLNQAGGGGTEPLTAIKVIGKTDEKRHSQADIMAIDGICQTIDVMHERKMCALSIGVVDPQGRQGKNLKPDGKAPTLRAQTHGNDPCVVLDVWESNVTGGEAKDGEG